jgi:dolichol-phosphate mannosyltransferase
MSRVLLSYFASKYEICIGCSSFDTTAGFVCFSRKVLENIGLDQIK